MTDAFLDQVARFADDHVAAPAAGWSMGESPDQLLYQKAGQLGVMGIEVPMAHGGLGLDFKTRAKACSILAGVDFGFAMSLVNTHNIALRLATETPAAIRDKYLPALLQGEMSACTALTERSAGSDFAAIQMTAQDTADGWVLNGEKAWIINGRHAGLAVVYAQCGTVGDSNGIAAFLVDLNQAGVSRYAIDGGFSQTGLGTGGFILTNVIVKPEYLMGAPGTAFKAILNEINAARTYVAAMCNGMIEKAIDSARAYGNSRMSFGKPLCTLPSWQLDVTEAGKALRASQTVVETAIDLVNAGADAQLAAAQAKVTAVTCAQAHLPKLLQLMGAEGLRAEHPFTRHIAAAQIAGFTDGATNILKDRIARLTGQK